jgi:Arc/MetJ-type ribon-helix-helix transcriptional regulator
MQITLSPETQKLLEEQMKQSGQATADEVVRIALESLRVREAFDYDDLDAATQASIEEAQAQCDRGEGIPVEQAFAELKRKHFGK